MVEKYIDEEIEYLFGLLPKGWEKVVLYSELDSNHYNIFFYVKYKSSYYQCYNLEQLCRTTEDDVDLFVERWYEIALKNKKKEEWKAFTLTVLNSGEFEVEYSYDDDFDLNIWKKQFLI